MVKKDFKARYMNSLFGTLWSVLNPLSQILIYTIVFSQVMRAKMPGMDSSFAYSIYICAGIIPWQLFSEILMRNIQVFLDQGNLLKKVSFPRSSLPIYVTLSALVNYVILLVLFLLVTLFTGNFPGIELIALIPLTLILLAIAVGLGVFLGSLNVFFRDIGQAFGIVIQFWFWLTPIVYPSTIVPEKFTNILAINVMIPIIKGYQDLFLYGAWPNWQSCVPSIIFACCMLIIGYFTFAKLNNEMVDEL